MNINSKQKIVIFSVLWIALNAAIMYATVLLNLSLNLFSWQPEFGVFSIYIVASLLLAIFACYKLATKTHGKFLVYFSLVVVLCNVGMGIWAMWDFYHESISHSILGRNHLSPHWFRISVFLLFSTPFLLWLKYTFRHHSSSS